jgi:DNA ligase-1
MPVLLHDFAGVNDAAAATSKKLVKQQVLAEFLRTLEDADLRLTVRYAGGRAFSPTDERVLGVSGAIVSDVILRLYNLDSRAFYGQVVAAGEMGEALAAVLRDHPPPPAPAAPLTLQDLSETFDDLARTGNVERKKELVRGLFQRVTTPREAAYLCKIIFSDLRTGVREGVLQAAVAEAFHKTLAEIQRGQLLLGDLDEVAILARRDALAHARFRLFHPLQFMLATPQETPQEAADTLAGRRFYAEDKLDGIRAQIHKDSAGRIEIYTRTMDRIDASFPDVVKSIARLPGSFLLDGEIVPWREGAVLPFAHLQRRLGRKVLSPKMLRENPAAFVAFDLLFRDGELLMDEPLSKRRAVLDALIAQTSGNIIATRLTEVSTANEIDAAFNVARDSRNEGLVLKDPESPYAPGRRGKLWLKLKTHLPTLDCVVTAAEYGHGKRRGVLSDYTFAVWDRDPAADDAALVNVGKAYSGVTDEEIAQLTGIFLKLSRQQYGSVHVVEPKIVLEIAFDQIQQSARHASGYALRFPRIKRIRWDKTPQDADRLERVAELYHCNANFGRVDTVSKPAEPTLFDGL